MSASLKILHLCSNLDSEQERAILDLIYLGRQYGLISIAAGLEVTDPWGGELHAHGGLPYYFLDKKPGLDWGTIKRLQLILREQKVNLLHAYGPQAACYGGLAARLAGCPMVYTNHQCHRVTNNTERWQGRLGARLARAVVCFDKTARHIARTVEWAPKAKLRLLGYGVDSEHFTPNPQWREQTRHDLKLSDADRLLISLGDLVPDKDYGSLLQAVYALANQGLPIFLLIVGQGEEQGHLEYLAKEMNIMPRVRLMERSAPIERLLPGAEVFVDSALIQGASLRLLEAQAAGLPAVVTAVGSNPEIVQHGFNGFLVPPARPDLLARAVAEILADPVQALNMGQAGRRRVQDSFSNQTMVRNYLNLYRELTSSAEQ